MAGSLGDLGGLLRQAKQMQRQVAEVQEKMAKTEFEGSSGGGAVKVCVNGSREFKSIHISPEVVDPEDVEMLEDLVGAALKEALKKAEQANSAAMNGVTGGMGLPGMT
ncbi:MAG: YbaB/EbfC family nucleoid-associated protein [Planctomycetota bacterium]|nr:YbaB/EbfC family nucleoid-associated protein [Planctomycetota bacterium]MDA1112853.1 YbaB/EbfC family nucleoid-associated protein [Planctomycetota bacterium]